MATIPIPQPTGNPLLDNPALKATLTQQMAQQQQAAAAQPPPTAMMPPGGAQPTNASLTLPPVPAAPKPNVALSPSPKGTLYGDEEALQQEAGKKAPLESVYSKISGSQFGQAHPLAGKLLGGLAQIPATALDVASTLPFHGAIGALTPGTSLHRGLEIQGLEKRIGEEEKGQQEQAQTGEANARTGLIGAQTTALPETAHRQQEQLQAQLAEHGLTLGQDGQIVPVSEEQLSPEIKAKLQGQWKPVPGVAGPNGEPMEYNQTNGQYRISPGSNGASVVSTDKTAQGSDFNQFLKDYLDTNKLPDTSQNRIKARGAWAAASQPPQRPPQVMIVNPQGQAQVLRPGQTVEPGSMTPTQLGSINEPTGQEKTAAGRAQIVLNELPRVESRIDKDATALGPIMGNWNAFMQGKLGMDNPEFSGLRSDLMLMSSAVALAHAVGRLPENLREQFDNAINAPKQTPGNLKSVLESIKPWMQDMTQMGRPGFNQGLGGGAQAFKVPEGAPAAPKEDNKYLYDQNKKPIAKSQGGKWVAP